MPASRRTLYRNLLLILLGTLTIGVNVSAGEQSRWFTSHGSSLVSRSSVELATGHLKRGIRLARAAHAQSLSDIDRLIVLHNLCVGLLQSGETQQASVYCTAASGAAQGYSIEQRRGASFIVKGSASSESLSAVVMGNIYQNSEKMQLVWQKGKGHSVEHARGATSP